jgi:hypothetical protein
VRSYFAAGLASLILDDRTEAIERGESPVLDGDPFVGHPEWDISDLSIDREFGGGEYPGREYRRGEYSERGGYGEYRD